MRKLINKFKNPFVLTFCILFGLTCHGGLNEAEMLSKLGLQWTDSFQYPEILLTSPANGALEISSDSRITIDFSKSMNTIVTAGGVSVTANGGNTSFTPSWIFDSRLILDFPSGLTEGKRYEVTLNRSGVKDTDGNFLPKNYIFHFYTVGGGQVPSIVSSSPQPNGSVVTGWAVNGNIIVTFSEPMDEASTNSAVSLSGGAALYIPVWNASRTQLTLQLKSDLEVGTTYTLKIGTSAKSSAGIALVSEYLVVFSTGSTFTRPDVAADVTLGTPWTAPVPSPLPAVNAPYHGVSKFDNFTFQFTETMDRQSVLDAIAFEPSISGVYSWIGPSLLRFTPNDPLTQGRTYRLKIDSTAKSSQGQLMQNGYVIDFVVDDPFTSVPIAFSSVNGRSYSIADCVTLISDLTITGPSFPSQSIENVISPQTACTAVYQFEVRLNTAGGVALKTSGDGDVFSNSNVSVDYMYGGPASPALNIYQINYIPTANPQVLRILLTGNPGSGLRYKFSLKGGSGGIQDTYGNFLSQDLEFLFYGN
ncbi:Ig-like domain-containing protein [Leptospira licerasiae]|uniref:Ig-like domain-containing protein n=1 Tax=Leptospira licerasiae TaxID=447106 RepID=UPI001FEF47BF|nr:Ig-like domain-containing protein [Leptospira licerasiae]